MYCMRAVRRRPPYVATPAVGATRRAGTSPIEAVQRRAPLFAATPGASAARRAMSAAASGPVDGKEKLVVFDTSLRDGEQSPGCTLQIHEKLAIGRQLSSLGVDVCEAGFPVASPGDFEAVSLIAKEIGPLTHKRPSGKPMVIAGLARALPKDIERCYEAVRHAPLHRVHTFLATSDLHLKHKLNISRAEAVERASKAVAFAASLTPDVEFSTEDAGRSDPAFLCELIGAVIEAGAKTINVPDTVGYTLPAEYGSLFAYLIKNTRGADRVVWSTHCHDDLGLATANTLAAVQAGARQVEVTVNGIGERAGNTSLEEVVMAINTRPALFPVYTTIDTTQITRSSAIVSRLTGMPVQPNKAIVGANAFAHESGIHQDGMLKNKSTYEIMTPESVGLHRSNLVLGKHSGRAAFKDRLNDLGFTAVSPAELDALVDTLKRLADEKKVITDADIQSVVLSGLAQAEPVWTLVNLHVMTGVSMQPTATVTLKKHEDGSTHSAAAMGSGPIDAVYNAIKSVTGAPNDLTHFSVQSVTDGTNALGEVTIKVSPAAEGTGKRSVKGLKRIKGAAAHASSPAADGGVPHPEVVADVDTELHGARAQYVGTHADKDIIVAAAHAYVAALNRLLTTTSGGVVGGAAGGARGVVVGAGAGGGV